MTFAVETATPALDFIATSDAAPTEQPEDELHGQTWPTDAYDDDDDLLYALTISIFCASSWPF